MSGPAVLTVAPHDVGSGRVQYWLDCGGPVRLFCVTCQADRVGRFQVRGRRATSGGRRIELRCVVCLEESATRHAQPIDLAIFTHRVVEAALAHEFESCASDAGAYRAKDRLA